jgi:hypothetical protein
MSLQPFGCERKQGTDKGVAEITHETCPDV